MAELNALDCLANKKNTGYGECVVDPGKLVGAYEIPRGRRFTKAEMLAWPDTLRTGVNNADKSQRFYPIGGWIGVTDNTEDPVFQTTPYGVPVPVRDGYYNWLFQYIKGGLCLSNALRSRLNGAFGDFLFYDDKGLFLGTYHTNATTGEVELGGVSPEVFYPYPWKLNDGANVAAYRVLFIIDPAQLNEGLGFLKHPGFNPGSLIGLQNINLVSAAAPAAGVAQIQTLSGCARTNLYDLYSTELAAAALWKAYNVLTGAAIPITSVAANAGLKAFTVTLDTAAPSYPVNATDKVRYELVDSAALATAGIVGYEGLPLTINRG